MRGIKKKVIKKTLEGYTVKVYDSIIGACHDNKISEPLMRDYLKSGALIMKGYRYECVK